MTIMMTMALIEKQSLNVRTMHANVEVLLYCIEVDMFNELTQRSCICQELDLKVWKYSLKLLGNHLYRTETYLM